MSDLDKAMNLLRQVRDQTLLTAIPNNGVLLRTIPGSLHHTIERFIEESEGWIEVRENGDPLWRLHRGDWEQQGLRITDTKVGADGKTIYIKVGK